MQDTISTMAADIRQINQRLDVIYENVAKILLEMSSLRELGSRVRTLEASHA